MPSLGDKEYLPLHFKMSKPIHTIYEPSAEILPIIISVPHSGTFFPSDLKKQYKEKHIHHPEDTDWFVDKLYDFAPQMGITMIVANLSRYVIDLNRSHEQKALYGDNRIETSLVPTKTFAGESIYLSPPDPEEIQDRITKYYWPYYKKIESLLAGLREKFPAVLFFDAHSITHNAHHIPSFSEMTISNCDGLSSSMKLIDAGANTLTPPYSFSINTPFKGGHLTRYMGKPSKGIHAMQLEMDQSIYMDESSCTLIKEKKVRSVLKKLFFELNKTLGHL